MKLGLHVSDFTWNIPPTELAGCLGTIASTLCQVAAARFDAMVTLQRCRGVDAAAGQLIVREAGGFINFVDLDDPLGAPLDATPSSRLISARSAQTLRDLEAIRRS